MRKVSIVIPLFNAEKYIKTCVRSCLTQDYPDIEVIVVDDGSSDNSRAALDSFMKRIVYIYQKNAGGSAARNTGVKAAKGYYLYFLDADDYLLPGTIRKMVEKIEQDESDICVGAYEEVDKDDRNIRTVRAFDKEHIIFEKKEIASLFMIYPNPSTKLFKSELVKDNGICYGQLRLAQDLNFYFKYLICCKRATYIGLPIYRHRIMDGTISTIYDKRILDIIKSFDDVVLFANNVNYPIAEIENAKFKHIVAQLVKANFICNEREKAAVFGVLLDELNSIKINNRTKTYKFIRKDIFKSKVLLFFYSIKAWFLLNIIASKLRH